MYNEAHKDGEGVGEAVRKDLVGSSKGKNRNGADLLIVVGTSLRVPGTKRMVREFSKAVRARAATPSASSSGTDEEQPIKSIYLNFDFPLPTREWDGVFDAWIQGDVQEFAEMLQAAVDKDAHAKQVKSERKRKREEEAAGRSCPSTPVASPSKKFKRRPDLDEERCQVQELDSSQDTVPPSQRPLPFCSPPLSPPKTGRTGFMLRIPPSPHNLAYVDVPPLPPPLRWMSPYQPPDTSFRVQDGFTVPPLSA